MNDRFVVSAQCPLLTQQRTNRGAALSDAKGQEQPRRFQNAASALTPEAAAVIADRRGS